MTLPIALDAMGGDFAPSEIIAGARRAVDELGLKVTLVGVPELMGDPLGLEVVACSEVIAMDDDPGASVRKKKDSSLVRAAELVRDGKASAMVSAGNTGATMASALLRMGRLPGVTRPCIATPIPRPGSTPTVLVDAGANAECTPEMLVQFALMASTFVATHYGVSSPKVGLLSIGEESSKGTPLVKATHELLLAAPTLNFVGNVEGRDLIPSTVDVVVTDGFTGNVALKTLEGALKFVFSTVLSAVGTNDATKAAGDVLFEYLLPLANELTPERQGGAMLLGVDGICVISHGSSNATAIMNALRVAGEVDAAGMVAKLKMTIRPDQAA
ncbi:MAG TPA: phosphate acyltransferase PlsX [Acidimicrobiales bacterium]